MHRLEQDREARGFWAAPRILVGAGVASIATWTADTESGRTEYVVRTPDTVVVRDVVYANGAERLFGEATYRRSEPTSRR